ncbi:MAG: polysaccharide deacetylase family protein [Ruminococcus flavefaciens]|nr:polysaccharide deacetylase family protein [Ruminococcus flavefaciens]MCM1229108.1 polysaccharide deacetylase family protein [Ruminococcus flavefaciens]
MYKCYNIKRFLNLLIIDAVIFSICSVFFFVGKIFLSSAQDNENAVFLPVIMYHSVYGDTPEEYIVTPQQLESDLQWLSANGYSTVTAEDVINYTRSKANLPEKCVMITLDDGFYNNLSVLVPLLEKYDMTAVVSVVGSYTDNNAVLDPHNPKYSYLTWDDITELQNSGRIELGNHTYNMHSLQGERVGCGISDGETEADYRKKLGDDIAQLQNGFIENIGTAPVVFAYPFGKVSRESLPVIRENGFLMTLTCRELPNYITRDPDCLYGIGRYNRSGLYSTEEYMAKLLAE